MLLRGNHETKAINRQYGFLQELEERFSKVGRDRAGIQVKNEDCSLYYWPTISDLRSKRRSCSPSSMRPSRTCHSHASSVIWQSNLLTIICLHYTIVVWLGLAEWDYSYLPITNLSQATQFSACTAESHPNSQAYRTFLMWGIPLFLISRFLQLSDSQTYRRPEC